MRRLTQIDRQIDRPRTERQPHPYQRVVAVGQQVLGLARVDSRDADQQMADGAQRQLRLNKCVGRLARRKSHHTAISNAAAPNSQRQPILFVDVQSVAEYIAKGNAAPVTPREPKFIKRGEDLSG